MTSDEVDSYLAGLEEPKRTTLEALRVHQGVAPLPGRRTAADELVRSLIDAKLALLD